MLNPIKNFYNQFNLYIVGGLALALGAVSLGWYITDLRLDSCQSARIADKKSYEKAQSDAELAQRKAIQDKENEYREKAKKADIALDALNAQYRDAVRLYTTLKGKASYPVAAPSSGSATSNNGPGEDTEFLAITEVVVPTNDLLICAENTARLVIARDWALGLNE